MSELKALDIVVSEEGYLEGIVKYRRAVYDKSEADKVIAEKDKTISEMKKACNSKDEWCLHTLKENRHQKYKRCLAMAYVEWLKQVIICFHPESILYRKAFKRGRKWKELAEKFKEAK